MIPTQEEWASALEQRHGVQLQKRFAGAAVAVCGLGGLGSNIAIALARAGVGRLLLIDFDKVDITNLHRQQYNVNQIGKYKTDALAENLRQIAPYIQIQKISEEITEKNFYEILSEADVICEAFDRAEAKAMLANHVLETMPGKYYVAASGMAGMGSPNTIRTRRVMKHFYLCGDEISDVKDSKELVSSRVMLCAAHQAHTVLRILAGEYEV